jgi:hypothetical protein
VNVIRCTPQELPHVVKSVQEAYRGRILSGLHKAAGRSHGYVIQRITRTQPYPPVNTGQYRRAWRVEQLPNGARLWNGTRYAPILELGARPGRIPAPKKGKHGLVPMMALLLWADQKLRGKAKATKVASGRARKERDDQHARKMSKAYASAGAAAAAPKAKGARAAAAPAAGKGAEPYGTRPKAQQNRLGAAWGMAVAEQKKLNRNGIRGRRILTAPEAVAAIRKITVDELRRAIGRTTFSV